MEPNEIEIKNLCPMIAMISAGKTSLLKVLFDIDYLESSPGIGTKFVTIIRYNPEVGSNPKFYHLLLKKKNDDSYIYLKDIRTEVVEGRENIKKKVIELNDELKNKEVPYCEIFYFLEIGTSNFIEDKEYLKNYDLVDIPGVSEYKTQEKIILPTSTNNGKEYSIIKKNTTDNNTEDLGAPDFPFFIPSQTPISSNKKDITIEDEMKTYNPEKEKNYLTEIFKIIKYKMSNGIIVFNIENYQLIENYRIIGKLQKVINKPIENFLILLNKIDKSENRNYDINTLVSKIVEYFPNGNIFNFINNTILACSAIQLENELKMNKSFYHLFYYHFINFLMNNQKDSDNFLIPTINTETFMDYLKTLIMNFSKNIKKKNFCDGINEIIKNKNCFKEIKESINIIKENHNENSITLGIRVDDFEEDEIIKIEEQIKKLEEEEEEEEEEDNDQFNIKDQENNLVILYFYSEFQKGKHIPPKSRDTKELIEYFTIENMKKKKIMEKVFKKKLN